MLVPLCFASTVAGRNARLWPAAELARPSRTAGGSERFAETGWNRAGSSAKGDSSSAAAAAGILAAAGAGRWRQRQSRRRLGLTARRAEAQDTVVSPFAEGAEKEEKPKLPLTWENVEAVLDELRPYLRSDGGDCKIVEIDGPIVKLELQGSCSSCSSSAVTLKMGIEKTLLERIPEIAEVISVMPDQEPLTEEGIEEVLNGIRPFLSVSGGSITLGEMIDPEGENPRIVLEMAGPPLKSMAVRVEVVNRMKRKFPHCQEVDIVAAEGEEVTSA